MWTSWLWPREGQGSRFLTSQCSVDVSVYEAVGRWTHAALALALGFRGNIDGFGVHPFFSPLFLFRFLDLMLAPPLQRKRESSPVVRVVRCFVRPALCHAPRGSGRFTLDVF